MKLEQREYVHDCATKLVSDLSDGTFKKNYRTNHGFEFSGGMEELYRYEFNSYLGSCGCFLMDLRLKNRRRGYCG